MTSSKSVRSTVGRRVGRSLVAGLTAGAMTVGVASIAFATSGEQHAGVAYTLGEVNREIGAADVHAQGLTGAGVTVAVIDTGVELVPGLDGPDKVVVGPDLSFESGVEAFHGHDTYGHGTVMASIIAGNDGVEDGFVGVAPGAQILAVKVADNTGAVDVSQVIAGIDWVIANKNSAGMNVRVLNLSYQTDSEQTYEIDPLAAAVERAWNAGIVVVASAGNDGDDNNDLGNPAMDPFIITVAALDEDYVGDGSLYSSEGDERRPDIAAPGSLILGLIAPDSRLAQTYDSAFLDERFFRGSGTSQATAITAGAVALLLEDRPELTPDQVKALLILSADDVNSDGESAPVVAGDDIHEFLDPALDDAAAVALDDALAAEAVAVAARVEITSIVDRALEMFATAEAEFDVLAGDKAVELRFKANERLQNDLLKDKAPAILDDPDDVGAFVTTAGAAAAAITTINEANDAVQQAEDALVGPVQALADAEAALIAAKSALDDTEDSVKTSENAVADAEDVVSDAHDAVSDAQAAVSDAHDAVADAEDAVADAEADLADAEADLADAEADLAEAEASGKAGDISKAQDALVDAHGDRNTASDTLTVAHDALVTAHSFLAAVQAAVTPTEDAVVVAEQSLATAEAALVDAETAVEDAEQAIDDSKMAIDNAKDVVDDAEHAVNDAEHAVKEALKDAAYTLEVADRTVKDAEHEVSDAAKDVDHAADDVAAAEEELFVDKPARRAEKIEKYSHEWKNDKLHSVGFDKVVGAGRLNVARAVHYRMVEVEQRHTPSDGSGSLEAARGSYNPVMPDGSLLEGEVTFTGSTWSGSTWSGSTWSGSTWSGSTWSGSTWSGSTWSGSTWSGSTWSGSTWSGSTWSGSTWSGSTWSGSTWSGSTWSGSTWSGSSWW